MTHARRSSIRAYTTGSPSSGRSPPLKDYTIPRDHWVAAVQDRGTNLSLADWLAKVEALGRDHWITDAQAATLRRGNWISPALWMEHLQEDGQRSLFTAPGDLLEILDGGHNRKGLTLECRIRPARPDMVYLGRSYPQPEERAIIHLPRFKRYPYRLIADVRLTPPLPGDRIMSLDLADLFADASAVAAIHHDQSGLAEGHVRILDEAGTVRVCRRAGPRWVFA